VCFLFRFCGVFASLSIGLVTTAYAQVLTYNVIADGIPVALTATPGDAQRGRAIVANRQVGMCLLCHQAPIVEEREGGNSGGNSAGNIAGDIATNLAGSGSRWNAAQLRLRIVDSRRVNPTSVMPAYHRVQGLSQVGLRWRERPILDAQQIEDVVAYLLTLK
jgi:L-cysteine S-thiosulfotransferase